MSKNLNAINEKFLSNILSVKFSNTIIEMKLKLCLTEEHLSYLEFCFEEVIKKNLHLKTFLLLMFAEKYPNLNLWNNTLKRRYDEYIHHKPKQSNNIRKKTPVIYNNLQKNNKLDCFYGKKSTRSVKMYNKRIF